MSFIPRLFLPSLSLKEPQIEMEESLSKYLTRVLRLQEGDFFRGFDGRGLEFELRLGKTNGMRSSASVVLRGESSQGRQGSFIALAQSLPKASKMDVILRQCTEAGVHRFMPILTERSISRPEVSQYDHKNNRWQKIIVEACRQCGRSDLPSLDPVLSLEQLVGKFEEFDLILLPYEKEAPTLKTVLESKKTTGRILILVGPEGGWSKEEVEKAEAGGAFPVHLPTPILRTETAGVSIVSMVQFFGSYSSEPGE